MAGAKRAAFSRANAALSLLQNEGRDHGRSYLHGATGAQAVAGNGAALVLPEPFPRDTRRAALSGVHGFVTHA
jgi:hypothetical protein